MIGLCWQTVVILFVSNGVFGDLTLEYFNNSVLHSPICSSIVPMLNWNKLPLPKQCQSLRGTLYTVRVIGSLSPISMEQWYSFQINSDHMRGIRLWIDDVILVDVWDKNPAASVLPGISNITLSSERTVMVRLDLQSGGDTMSLQLFWRSDSEPKFKLVPETVLSENISVPQQKRQKLQKRIATGWNHWYRHSMLAQVLLPHQVGLDFGVLDKSNGNIYTGGGLVLNSHDKHAIPVRPGLHSYNGSYSQISLIPFVGINITVETAHSLDDENDCVIKISHNLTINSSRFSIIAYPQAYWHAKTNITVDFKSSTIIMNTTLGAVHVFFSTPIEHGPDKKGIAFDLTNSHPSVGITMSLRAIAQNMSQILNSLNQRRQDCEMTITRWGNLSEAYDAILTSIAWNVNFDPRISVIAPVSRTFEGGNDILLFDWDIYFLAFMASLDNKELAYTNLIAVTQTRSVYGFIPNKRTEGSSTNDRSEPYVGAQVTLKIYQKYKDDWLVELLFPALFNWNQWVWKRRRYSPHDLIVLGSDTGQPPEEAGHNIGSRGDAILESGMDNSPMYDKAGYDKVAHRVLLYDVGMTSLFLAESRALVELARIINKTEVIPTLQKQYDATSKALDTYLWDKDMEIYANFHIDTGKFSTKYSPTSFYPMLIGLPSIDKVLRMLKVHLTNESSFCVSDACPFAVPATPHNDPNFFDNNYWRGRVWGPLNLLVYLSLANKQYVDHPNVTQARKRLCKQAMNTLLPEFRKLRHIHENYNSTTGQGSDVGSSNPFYHWGALNAFISFLEAGLY